MKRLKSILLAGGVAALLAALVTGCMSTINYAYKNGDKYTPGDRTISEKIDTIDIDYLSGDVNFSCDSTNAITIKETANKEISDKMKVHTWVDGSTLYVRYCASAKSLDFNNIEKKLDITVPADVELENLRVDISSGSFTGNGFIAQDIDISASSGKIDVDCTGKKIALDVSSGSIGLKQHGDSDSIKLDATSGKIKAEVENANKIKMSQTSGDVNFEGNDIKDFDYDVTSGDGNFKFGKAPETSSFTGTSSDITIYIPSDSDLTADVDITSGDFDYELGFEKKDGKYIAGSGANKMSIDTTSGDIEINQLKAGE